MKSCIITVCHTKCYQMVCLPYLLRLLLVGLQPSSVCWYGIQLGECFRVLCGVRQGGALSPYLFALYINDFIDDVKKIRLWMESTLVLPS